MSGDSSKDTQAGGGVLGAVGGVIGGYQEGQAKQLQADFQANQEVFNAKLLNIQKKQLLKSSDDEVARIGEEVGQMVGSNKASLAAQGIDVSGDLAAAIEKDTQEAGLDDIVTLKNNAWRAALGLEIQESNLKTQSQFTRLSGKSARRRSISEGYAKFVKGAEEAAKAFGGGGG